MFHLDFGHSPRAGAISAADRAALTAAENAWLDYYVKGVGSEPADARGGVDILTSKCPVSGAGTRYHAPSWALLAPGEVRIDGAARADDRRARHRAEQRVHLRRRLHDDRRAPTTRRAATYKVPAATSAYTLAGSPTIVAKLDITGANDMVAARLYDVDGATAAPDRPRRPAPARRRRRPDRAGLPAAPAGLDRPARPRAQARAARPGLAVPAHAPTGRSSRSPCQRPAAAAAGRRRAGPRPRHGVSVASPAAKFVPPGDKLARDYATDATGGVGGTVPGHALADARARRRPSARSRPASTASTRRAPPPP